MEKLQELRDCVEALGREAGKFFENGNKAAGVRARRHVQELKEIVQSLRETIQKTKMAQESQERKAGRNDAVSESGGAADTEHDMERYVEDTPK